MANELDPTAWIAIGLLAVFILAINFGLISALFKKKIMPPPAPSRLAEFMRHPFGEEDRALKDLSEAVKGLNNSDETLYKDQNLTRD